MPVIAAPLEALAVLGIYKQSSLHDPVFEYTPTTQDSFLQGYPYTILLDVPILRKHPEYQPLHVSVFT